ncbi:hypothetical protein [Aminipila terrae]|uniref:Uncharacterized protein n=1 Tax=Aminipila terrae TaxID=2697030 RepID=A0A6P1MAZ0_9FIRM|nr:hypothetical protein [Aminipila terrae]QHI71202.1 hypothetical protein Ami3637_01260 [Aminipila terrae]
MDDIMDIKCKCDDLFQKAMENHSFMQVFYGEIEGDEEEIALKNKLILLNKAIDDFQTDLCGCGHGIRIQSMKSLIREIQSYI